MINEQIKKEIAKEIELQLQQNSIESIVLNSSYHVLTFTGFSTGVVNLTHLFDDQVFQRRRLLIKSFRVIPFAQNAVDELWNATTNDHYQILENARITKCVDEFTSLGHIQLFINNVDVNIFPFAAAGGQVLDLFVDNIYFNYKSPVESLEINIQGQIVNNFETQANDDVKIKVLMECYSY